MCASAQLWGGSLSPYPHNSDADFFLFGIRRFYLGKLSSSAILTTAAISVDAISATIIATATAPRILYLLSRRALT